MQEEDRAAFHRLSETNRVRYLTLRLNLAQSGLKSARIRLWGVFDEESSEMRGVAMRVGNTLVLADEEGECGVRFAELADSMTELAGLRGSKATAAVTLDHLKRWKIKTTEASMLMSLDIPVLHQDFSGARKATEEDIDGLASLYSDAGVMTRSRAALELKLKTDPVHLVEIYDVRQGAKRVVSAALINGFDGDGAVVAAVYTLPEMRGRGYASRVTASVCRELQSNGLTPHLFYENPIAGHVYRKLGFVDRDPWTVAFLQKGGR